MPYWMPFHDSFMKLKLLLSFSLLKFNQNIIVRLASFKTKPWGR